MPNITAVTRDRDEVTLHSAGLKVSISIYNVQRLIPMLKNVLKNEVADSE